MAESGIVARIPTPLVVAIIVYAISNLFALVWLLSNHSVRLEYVESTMASVVALQEAREALSSRVSILEMRFTDMSNTIQRIVSTLERQPND